MNCKDYQYKKINGKTYSIEALEEIERSIKTARDFKCKIQNEAIYDNDEILKPLWEKIHELEKIRDYNE